MLLAKLPYQEQSREREILGWSGLNASDGAKDGEIGAGVNLSSRRYPFLSPRRARAPEGTYTNPSDLFAWEQLVVVDELGTLFYGGKSVGTVTPGEKQMAVITNRLVIFPDQIALNLETSETEQLAALARSAGQVTVTPNSMSFVPDGLSRHDMAVSGYRWDNYRESVWVNTYGKDASALSWSAEGGWIKPDPIPVVLLNDAEGYIVIPQTTDGDFGTQVHLANADWSGHNRPPNLGTDEENNLGYYAVITKTDGLMSTTGCNVFATADVYNLLWKSPSFADILCKGDAVDISGDERVVKEKAIIIAIDEVTNTLTFADDTFESSFTTTEKISVQRNVPKLDFICACNNRIWGVCNETKTIHASALGDPKQWWDYTGESTDSYAVGVGSAGDFTGICARSGSVLCWKEDILHRMVGYGPADYSMYDDTFEGVQAGSHRAMEIINDTLFFKGRNGVYAYSGGQPVLISYPLGTAIYKNATAGTDGLRYYISMQDEDGTWHLFSYDTVHGSWLRQDNTQARAFARLGGTVYIATAEGVLRLGAEGFVGVDWSATLVAFDEDQFEFKQYNYLRLMVDIAVGGTLAVDISIDGGVRTTVYRTDVAGQRLIHVRLPLMRARAMTVTLHGTGDVVIRKLDRQYTICSAYGGSR